MKLVLFGSSLVSAYWNGAATYYRGICKAMHARGHEIVFVEPDIYERQAHLECALEHQVGFITDPGFEASVQALLRG